MQCKKALEEAGGDSAKALVILKKKSSEIAAKKGDRTLGASRIATYLHANGAVGSMVQLSSETDFVSKNDEFGKLAYDIAMHVAASNPEFLQSGDITEEAKSLAKSVFSEEVKDKPEAMREKIVEGKLAAYFKDKVLLEQAFIKNPDVTIGGLIESAVQKFGERIEIVRYNRFSA